MLDLVDFRLRMLRLTKQLAAANGALDRWDELDCQRYLPEGFPKQRVMEPATRREDIEEIRLMIIQAMLDLEVEVQEASPFGHN